MTAHCDEVPISQWRSRDFKVCISLELVGFSPCWNFSYLVALPTAEMDCVGSTGQWRTQKFVTERVLVSHEEC